MPVIYEETVRCNSGWSCEMGKGERIRITWDVGVMDFVCFNLHQLTDRFDQARTKANMRKLYVTKGDRLYSKLNHVMLTIVEDTYKGHHDLDYGTCSKLSFDEWWARRDEPAVKEEFEAKGITKREDIQLWGCFENIICALQNYPIMPCDIPSSFNIGQSMDIEPGTSKFIWHWLGRDRPEPGTYIEMHAEMDLLCAGSNHSGTPKLWPDGAPMKVQVFRD